MAYRVQSALHQLIILVLTVKRLKDRLVKIRAYDTKIDDFVELKASDCEFGYRDSIFKTKEYGRYIITQLILN